eukprot:COSAG02_NODE_1507_length_12231_cov_56.431751_7_plen_79_part_00
MQHHFILPTSGEAEWRMRARTRGRARCMRMRAGAAGASGLRGKLETAAARSRARPVSAAPGQPSSAGMQNRPLADRAS